MVRTTLALLFLTISAFTAKAADFYWVGGSGDWSDIANHWATTSGGSTFHVLVPTPLDDVHFDANSFGSGTDVVTITFEAFCKSFTAANMPAGVTFQFNSGINMEEDFSVDGDVNINHHTGNFVVKNGDVTLDNSVHFYKTNGHFYVTGGDVFLGDDVYFDKRGWVQQTYIYNGTFYFTGSNATFYHYDGYLRCYDGGMNVTNTNYFYTSSHDGYFYGDLEVASGGEIYMSRTTRMYNGGVSFDAAATITQNANLYFYTTSMATYDIKTGGHEMRRIELTGTNYGATYNLQDDLNCQNEGLYLYANVFKSNGHAIDVGRFYCWTGGIVKVDLTGTSLVRVKREWRMHPSTNTTLIIDNANILLYQATNHYFYGGSKTYNDVTFDNPSTGGVQIYINYDNTFDNVIVNSYGNAYLRWYNNNTMANFTWNYLNDVNSQQTLGIYGSNTVTGTLDFNLNGNRPIIQMNGSNNIGTLDFDKPKQILLGAGSTQTVGTINPIIGTCDETILINSTSLNSTARLSQATGTVVAEWALMQDNTAQGGATFNATNTVDLGNVNGWNITALTAVTYYWIGGSGNWNDPNHWSLSSGGATNGCAIPSRIDDVIFDANSFTGSGQFCNMNVVGDCHTMTWNGVTTGAGFNGGQALNIYGNLTCDANMNWSKSGDLYFQATDAGNTITTNGIKLYQLRFTGQGVSTGEWILQDDLACHNTLFFERGKFVSNGHDLDVYSFYNWTGSVANIDFTGTTTIELDREWRIYPSTNITLNMDEATIHHYSNNHMYFYGGGKTYHDLNIEFINTGNYYVRHEQHNTFRDVKITAPGSFYSDWYHNSTFRNFEAYQNGTGNTQQHFTWHGTNTFNNFTFKGNGNTKPYWRVYNNNTVNGTLTLENLIRWEINAGRTQTINQGTITADCNQWMELRSRSYNSQTNISVPAGNALTTNYVYLQDINSSGAGDIDAYNSADINNNSGNIVWNTTTPTNFYWVGDAGSWSDLNNWSYASGGTPGVTCLPSLLDNVFFDVNSFSASGQNVNINVPAYCNNMIWDNVNFPTISGTSMYIYGSMILDKNLTWNNGSWIYMMATDQGNTIKTEGVQLYYLDFRSSYSGTGEWTLQDDLDLRYDMWLRSGTLRSGGNEITLRSFFAWENRDMTLDLSGSSVFNLSHWWQWYPNNSNTLIMDDCDLNWDYEGYEFLSYFGQNETFNDITYNHTASNNHRIYNHYTNGSTFGNIAMNLGGYQRVEFHQNIVADDITINYTNPTNNIPTVYFYNTANLNTLSITSTGNAGPYVYLNQSNTFNDLVAAGVGTRLYLGANRVQTVNGILSIGSGGFPVHLRSTSDGSTATLYKPSGEVCLDFVLLKDVTATSVNGSDVTDNTDFFAGAQSADLGNNSSNWNFSSCGAYYWVGGTGDWSDLNHWATSSGGSINHTILPGSGDDVYFDANSFNGANQVVTIDVASPTAKNMTWQSALYTPTLVNASGADNLYIHGSLKLIPSMNQNFAGDWNFMSNVSGNTVNSAGQPMTDVTFVGGNDGEGGWDLDNILDVSGTIDFRNGSLDLDDWDVSTKNFDATTPNTRVLSLTSSEISINDGQWNPSDATNLTFDKGTSKIVVQGTSASNFFGNGLSYNDVTFTSTGTLNSDITGSNTFNTLRFEAGVTATIDAGTTQSAAQIEAAGECTRNVVWKSSSVGNDYNFSQASGTTDVEFTAMSDNNGSGSATYDAALSTNNGGNTNWNFSSAAILTVSQETGLVDCITNNDGFAKVTPLTGTAPYSYVWSTLETTQQINGLLPGTYTVTVTDANGCTAVEDLDVINQPSALDPVDFSISDPDVCIGTMQTFTADDISSTALDFDGSGDHVLVANNSAFETSTGTIEMWLNSAGSSDNEAFVGMRTSTSNTRYSFHVNEGNNTIGIYNGAGFYTLSQNINVGQWYHIALTFNATTTTVYVDGASIGTLPGINTSKTGMALSIGSPNDGAYSHEWFTGRLDDVRIWDDIRTPSEILALKDIPLYGSESNLVAYYNFEDGTGSATASDKTANGFDGTLTNMDANTDWVSPGGLNPTVTYEWDFDDFTSASTQTANHTYGSGGTYEVELKVRDAAGCPVTTTKTVQVGNIQQSVTKVNVLCKGESNGSIDVVGSGGVTPYQYSIDGGATYVSTSTFNSLAPGTYQVRTKDAIGCETSIQSFAVTEPGTNVAFTVANVIDTECPGELTGGFTINATGGTPSYVYSINNGINYVPFNVITGQSAGTYTVKVRDANGCETTSQTVVIDQVDDEDPEVNGCPTDFTVFTATGQCDATATWTAPTATDNCGNPSINQTQGAISGSTFALGVHTIEYEISDADGNTVTCSFDITVKDQGNPTAKCMNTTVYLDANGEATITAADIDDNSFDDCSSVTLSASQTDFTTAHLGNNNVVLTVTDAGGNTSTCTAVVTVVDNTDPDASCKNITVQLDANGDYILDPASINDGSTDNSGVFTLSASQTAFNCTDVGANPVTLTVTDGSNNTATCTATVTVEDNVDPNAICQNITVQLDANGDASITASQIDNGSNDACGIASLIASQTDFDCTDAGANTVTLTVTDNNGNTSTCDATVTVQDNIDPEAMCKNITVSLDANGEASIAASDIDNGSNDACGIASLSLSQTDFDCDDVSTGTNNQALLLNGSNSASALVNVTNAQMGIQGTSFTAMAWINLDQYAGGGDEAIISNDGCLLHLSLRSQKPYLGFCHNDIAGVTVINTNQWYHLAFVYDASTSTQSIYVNGVLDVSGAGHAPLNADGPIRIGSYGTSGGFNGEIDEVQFWNSALSITNIQQYMNASPVGNEAGLLGYWNFEEASGTTANDLTGNNNATLTGSATRSTNPAPTSGGGVEVTLTVVDNNGNTSTCDATVTVEDNTNPTASCNNLTIDLQNRNAYTLTQSDIDYIANGSDDNCSFTYAITSGKTTFDCDDRGQTHTVILTVTDASGNTSTCDADITVTNQNSTCNDPPVAVCKNITIYTGANCNASIVATDVDGGSTDPDGDPLTYTLDNYGPFNVGTHTVTLTVGDGEYTDDCTATVTVEDNTNPNAVCKNITIQLDANGEASIVGTDINDGSSDACGIASLVAGQTDFDCTHIGANTVTLTVTDNNNNVSTCTSTVTVEDNVEPEALCKSFTVGLDYLGTAEATALDINDGSNDACGISNLAISQSQFDCSHLGSNEVVLTVTDNHSNVSTCTTTVTVIDTTAPMLVCNPWSAGLDVNGEFSLDTSMLDTFTGYDLRSSLIAYREFTRERAINRRYRIFIQRGRLTNEVYGDLGFAYDACSITGYSASQMDFDCSDVGDNAIVITVTDASGNTTTCNDTITIYDSIPPAAICKDITIELDANGEASIVASDIDGGSNDACGIASISASKTDFICSELGDNTVTLTVTDNNGNVSTCTATVTVEDNIAPEFLSCQCDVIRPSDAGKCEAYVKMQCPVITDDNCSVASVVNDYNGTSDATDTYPVGVTTVTWTVTDQSGNSSDYVQVVMILDIEKPTATCVAPITQTVDAGECGADVVVAAPIAADNCGIMWIENNRTGIDNANDWYPVGTTTVRWLIQDVNGNFTYCTSTVTVEDDEAPSITCPADVVASNDNGNCTAALTISSPTTTDNCSVASVSNDYNNTSDASDTYPVGTTTVTWTVTDIHGNSSTCTQLVTVEDTETPAAICKNATVQLDATGNGSISVADIDNGSSDNCGIASMSLDNSSFGCSDVGVNTVTLTVTDIHGNSSTCTASVTVEDNVAPTAICQNITVQLDASGMATIVATDIDNNSNDACGVASLAVNTNSFDCSNVGANSVTLTVTDNNGNSSTCTATVTVEDNIAPNAICQNLTLQLDANGQASTTAAAVNDGSNDACGISSLSLDQTTFDCSNIGDNVVMLTVEDNNGNQSTCQATITIEDNVAPSITCPANVNVNNDNNDCGAQVTVGAPTTSDNCAVASVVNDYNNSSNASDHYPVGTTNITWTVTDVNGNQSTCGMSVTVTDNQAPDAICQNLTVQLDANGDASITVSDIDNGSYDNCGVDSKTISVNSFDCSDVGANTVTLTVTDIYGNSSTCTSTVTVEDNVNPIAICKNATVQLDANGQGSITTTDINNGSNDACGIASMSLNQTDFNCSHVGQNIVTLTVVDNNGNSSTCQASVTVRDEVAPAAICQNITVQLNASGTASITANDVNNGSNDACGIASMSIDNSSFSCTDVGANTVILTVTDNNGNSSTCTSTVTVEDNVAPTASCKNITVQLDANGDATINASDVNDGSSDACGIASISIDNASFDCSDVGANTVTLTVVDNNGNSSTCTSTVTVEDNVAPDAVCKNITVQLNAMGDASIVASDINNGSSDACGIANLAASKTSFNCSDVGANTVILTVTDNNGNSSTCNATVTVEDNVAPNAICQNITVQLDATGAASISASDVNNGSNDACGIASMTINNGNFDCSNVGANTVTLTVTDNNGNSSTCTSTVTVEDNVAPNAICQNITVQLDVNGDASISASDVDNGSNDACGIASTTINTSNFDCSDVGVNAVTLTVTDNNGNSSTCTAMVTVEDNVKPQAICKDIIIQLDANGNASIVANDINNGSNDACGIASLAASKTSFDCSNLGVNNVTLTVTDNNGNSSSCMAKVTVQDNIAPIISGMPSNITVNAQRNDCDPIVTWTPPTASDNCSVVSFTASNQSGEEFVVGTHTVSYLATDQSNNSTSGSFTITVVPDPLVITSLSATTYSGGYNISCNGNSDGSATVIVEGGCLPYAYDWSSGHTSNSASGLQAGTYTVTITDANGTVTTKDITLTEPDALTATVATTDIVCHIEADQTCKLYPYSSGQHAVWLPNLPGSPSSKYIFDTHGSFEVYADGSAHLTGTVVNASNSNYSWEIDVWFTGKMNWTDWSALGRGWKGNSSVVGSKYKDWDYYVMDQSRIATLSGKGNYAGKTLYLSHKPSTLYYGFQVGKAANDKDYSNGMSGWFTYNGDYTGQGDFNFDSNCKSSQKCDCEGRMREFTVSYSGGNNAKVYARTGSNYSHWNCKNLSTFTNVQDGDNLTISGNWKSGRLGPKTWLTIGGVRYEIHTSCSEDILGKTFGPFTVTSYTDGDGNYCSVNTGMGCDGEAEIAISGGTAPFTVEWTNGATGTDVTGICMGTYGVNVTDANGCTYYTTFTINNPEELELTLSETDPACHDGSDGSIDATVSGGVAPYTYTWSNNESTQDINNLPAGTYELIVTDAGGCSVIAEVTLDNPKQSIYLSGTVYDASCSGKADGAINLKVYCSKKISSIVWSHGPTTEDVSGLAAGTYSVTVTDKYGCSETMSFTVEEPDPVSVSASSPTYSNGYNISSYGALDGAIDLTVSGGTPGYTYDWSGSTTTTATMTRQVNHKYADAEENKKGSMSTRSSDLELVEDGSNGKQQVGLLFSHINIPQGATITEAYIQFTTEGTSRNSSSVNLNIYGHDVDNSWMFTSKKRNISSRTTTSSNVNWQPAKWTTMNESGAKQTTPDVSGIVQEIVDRSGWKDGYCMTFLIKGSGLREAWSYDGSSSKAPVLIIKYEEQVTGSNPDDLGAGYYTVKVTDRNGCATSTSITLTQPTQGSRAVKDERVLKDNAFGESVGQAALEISPNPVSQTATVTFNLEEQTQAVVRVTDMTGKTLETVYTGLVPAAQDVQVQTSLEGLRSGIYQISITTTNGQHIVKRFVIAR